MARHNGLELCVYYLQDKPTRILDSTASKMLMYRLVWDYAELYHIMLLSLTAVYSYIDLHIHLIYTDTYRYTHVHTNKAAYTYKRHLHTHTHTNARVRAHTGTTTHRNRHRIQGVAVTRTIAQ